MILKNVSVDCIIFGFKNNKLHVLLWKAENELLKNFLTTEEEYEQLKVLFEENPTQVNENCWGLIGSHLPYEEGLDEYAKKLLQVTTGFDGVFLKQLKTFGAVKRVPYCRVLTVVYYALINPDYHDLKSSPLAKSVQWFDIENLPEVGFDIPEIIQEALQKLREDVRYYPIGFHLLQEKFTLTQLQTLYELILGKNLDTRNFRKKILKMGLLTDTGKKQANVPHRAAKLYAFHPDRYHQLVKEGLAFRI